MTNIDPALLQEDMDGAEDLYREHILDHYRHPHHKGAVSACTHRAREANPLCGDEVDFFLRIGEDGRVREVGFEGHGCAISQAAISMLTDWVTGKNREEILSADEDLIQEMLGVRMSPTREKCAFLGLRALKKALTYTNPQINTPNTTNDTNSVHRK